MSDPSTAVAVQPFVALIEPYIVSAAGVIIPAAFAYGAMLFRRWTGIKINQANLDSISAAAKTQAGLAIAKAADNLSGKSIDAHSPQVQAGAMFVADALKESLTATGMTPDDVAHLIAAEIGKLQAQATVPVAPAPTPSS